MNRSDLIARIADAHPDLSAREVEQSVRCILEQLTEALANNQRIEIRGFGSFDLNFRTPRAARNPKTGESVSLPGHFVPHFKPGKELRERVKVIA